MKNEPTPPNDDGKTPHERFLALGKTVMTVPKSTVDARDEEWRKNKKSERKRTASTK